MKCANCPKDAFYIYSVTRTKKVYYCHSHLPKFLHKQRQAGLLQTTEEFKTALNYDFNQVEEPVVEEELPTEEVAVEETPAPVKKKSVKKAAK